MQHWDGHGFAHWYWQVGGQYTSTAGGWGIVGGEKVVDGRGVVGNGVVVRGEEVVDVQQVVGHVGSQDEGLHSLGQDSEGADDENRFKIF